MAESEAVAEVAAPADEEEKTKNTKGQDEDAEQAAGSVTGSGATSGSGAPPNEMVKQNASIRVHFYLGPVCRSEIINPDIEFATNKSEILAKFGIGIKLSNDEDKQAEYNKYTLKLKDGGLVEKNGVLFHDDRVLIIPKDEYLQQ